MTRSLCLFLIVSAAVAGCAQPQPQQQPQAPAQLEAAVPPQAPAQPQVAAQPAAPAAPAAPVVPAQAQTQEQQRPQSRDPEAMAKRTYERGMEYVGPFGMETGELFCWYSRGAGGSLLSGYRRSGDAVWLDYAEKYLDELVARMAVGPDGYKGFIGTYGYDESVWCDVHIGDSILVNLMLEFAEIVAADDALGARYGEKARHYIAIGKRDLIEKWDARGTWREDGPYGGYVSWNHYGDPGDFTNWTQRDEVDSSTLALPFNKSMNLAVACLRLYRLTGEKAYRDKAAKVFAWFKSRMQLVDDHYVWNYWEPLVATDVDVAVGDTRHWMNVHPYRNYQTGEVGDIVEAYHTGVVFTEQDIRRIINTNLKVMWNGSLDDPQWNNSNFTVPGWRPATPSEEYPGRAGTLWGSLADFDQTIRDIGAARRRGRQSNRSPGAAAAEPPSFERKHASGGVETMEFPFHHCPAVTVAAALPSRIRKGEGTVLVAKVPISGRMEIALHSADGQTRQAVLFDRDVEGDFDGHGGIIVHQWDAAVAPGDYRIRWTFGDGYREFPITIEQ